MKCGGLLEVLTTAFIPSRGELLVSLAVAGMCIILSTLLRHLWGIFWGEPSSRLGTGTTLNGILRESNFVCSDFGSPYMYLVRVELLAAKDLIAVNIGGTSDPYAIITCGSDKRFSSMIPATKNPIWGEGFEFLLEGLPAEVHVSIYDWDIFTKSTRLGSMTLTIDKECETEATWFALGDGAGQVYLKTTTKSCVMDAPGSLARKRLQDKQVGTQAQQKPGPLQSIFELPPDETVEGSFSCALERSFLYHGRMYVSLWHICFHSNVFAKQLKVVLPYESIEEIKKGQHALINPAIIIILRAGSGGVGVPPLAGSDGRPKYMFASFWNRNHVLRVLQRALSEFRKLEEDKQPLVHVPSSSFSIEDTPPQIPLGLNADDSEKLEDTTFVQPFLNEEVLVEIMQGVQLRCTAEQFFSKILSDDSTYIKKYHVVREDKELKFELWHASDQYGGLVRTITYRSLCRSPMCPSETAVTELQHVSLSNDKTLLRFEKIQQAHDVPFGSAFEVQARWTFKTTSEATCTFCVQMGTHFKKLVLMSSKIRSSAQTEYKSSALLFSNIVRKGLEEDKLESTLKDEGFGLSRALQDDDSILNQGQ